MAARDFGQVSLGMHAYLDMIEKNVRKNDPDSAFRVLADAKQMLGTFVRALRKVSVDLLPPDVGILGLCNRGHV